MPTLAKKRKSPSHEPFIANSLRMADLAAEKKATDIKIYDVRGLTLIADSFVICNASSEPQLKAVFNSVRDGMKEIGVSPLHAEGAFNSGWLILDYGDILFHLFRPEAREFYDLDGMWADARDIPLNRDDAGVE